MNATVIKVKQSPLNAERWLLVLSCRHEVWITSKRRPTRKTFKCNEKHESENGETK